MRKRLCCMLLVLCTLLTAMTTTASVLAAPRSAFTFVPDHKGTGFELQAYDTFMATDKTKVTVPATYKGKAVTSIGKGAFDSSTYLETVELPDSINSIGEGAFRMCQSLKTINLPKKLSYLGAYTFQSCGVLDAVELPSGLKPLKPAPLLNAMHSRR